MEKASQRVHRHDPQHGVDFAVICAPSLQADVAERVRQCSEASPTEAEIVSAMRITRLGALLGCLARRSIADVRAVWLGVANRGIMRIIRIGEALLRC